MDDRKQSVAQAPPAAAPAAGTAAVGVEVLAGRSRRRGLAALLPFLGPAFIASVAYIDPGNFATNIQGGAQLGYTLLWVVLASNLMAMLVQTLSAKLGLATGKNLAELCRTHYPRWFVLCLWGLMEIVAMATDLAEFLGAALGFQLLFGIPLGYAGLLTAAVTFGILLLQRYGFRPLEAVITALVGVVGLSYLVEVVLSRPDWGQVAFHSVVPQFGGHDGVLLATGILGATVMPHVIFLHSALMQDRIVVKDPAQMRRLFHFELVDVVVAMGIAGLINMAMLIVAAQTMGGMGDSATIPEAYKTLPMLGTQAAKYFFGIALLASGLSSSAVGTMSGQVIMQGFLNYHIPVWVRRLATMAPALIVIWIGLDPTRTLVVSQVVLSFGLPFAVVPLLLFTRRKDVMGVMTNKRLTTAAAGVVAAMILALNAYLLYQTFTGS